MCFVALLLLASSVLALAQQQEDSLAQKFLDPDKSLSFPSGKTLSSFPSKLFHTARYPEIPIYLPNDKTLAKPLDLPKTKKMFFPVANSFLAKSLIPKKFVVPKTTLPSSEFFQANQPFPINQPSLPEKTQLPPDSIVEKINKKMSIDDIRELLNRSR
jgi:hypothetical protein